MSVLEALPLVEEAPDVVDRRLVLVAEPAAEVSPGLGPEWAYTDINDEDRAFSWKSYAKFMADAGVETGGFVDRYRDPGFDVLTEWTAPTPDTETTIVMDAVPVAVQDGRGQVEGGRKHPEDSRRWWRQVGGLGAAVSALIDGSYFRDRLQGRLPRVRHVAAALSRIRLFDVED